MARFYPSGGTGGADVSVVTAMEDDVAKGKVIVGPDGEPMTGELELTGTAADSQVLAGQTYYNTDLHQKRTGAMANQGAWKSEGLAAGAEVAIPPGYHNGGGKVTAKDLVSQTPGDATAAQIWDGRKAWVNGQQVMGTLATQGGSTTIPGTAAKTIVTPNKIVTGNVVVAGDPNLIPANIKKNVTIFGVRGTHSGYVPSATDLYLRGNNPAGIVVINGVVFDSGQMSIATSSGSTIQVAYNFAGYTKLNFEGATYSQGTGKQIVLQDGAGSGLANVTFSTTPPNNFTQSIDISALQKNATWRILFKGIGLNSSAVGAIYRIWLS